MTKDELQAQVDDLTRQLAEVQEDLTRQLTVKDDEIARMAFRVGDLEDALDLARHSPAIYAGGPEVAGRA